MMKRSQGWQMSKNNPRKDTSQRKTLEGISQEEWLDAHLKGFEKWIQQYKRIVKDKSPHMALGDIQIASDNETQSSQLQEAFLDTWKIIITKVKSPENIEHIRNTLDDLMGDYDFLARKLRRRFGSNYGLEGFKTGSTKKKSKDYEPRRLHMKFIRAQLESGVTNAATAWDNFVHEGLKGDSVVGGEKFKIEFTYLKLEADVIIGKSEKYQILRRHFCDQFRYQKKKMKIADKKDKTD